MDGQAADLAAEGVRGSRSGSPNRPGARPPRRARRRRPSGRARCRASSPRRTAIPGLGEPEPPSRRSSGLRGEARHAVRPERRRPHEVDDGPAGDERSAGRSVGSARGRCPPGVMRRGHASGRGRREAVCYSTAPFGPFRAPRPPSRPSRGPRMARSCAICGKVSMGGFNPQSSGMNRVRAHRRMKPNLQPLVIDVKGTADEVARLHPLPPHAAQVGQVTRRTPLAPTGRARGRSFAASGRRGAPDVRATGPDPTLSPEVELVDRAAAVVDEAPRHAEIGVLAGEDRLDGGPRPRPRRSFVAAVAARIRSLDARAGASAGRPSAISARATRLRIARPRCRALESRDQLGRLASVGRVGGRGSTSARAAVVVRPGGSGSGSARSSSRRPSASASSASIGFEAGRSSRLARSDRPAATRPGPPPCAVSIASLAAVSDGNGPRTSGRPNSLVWVVSTMTHVPDCGSIWNRPSLVSQRPPPSRVSASAFAIDAVSPSLPVGRVEPDRERAVVDELDRHLGTEPPGRDRRRRDRAARPRSAGRGARRAPVTPRR